jgi:hypothetical protein
MQEKTDKKQFFPALTWPQATLIVFLGVAGFFLLAEHKAHILGLWPYLILLLCPFMHIFMHKRHGHHDGSADKHKNHIDS